MKSSMGISSRILTRLCVCSFIFKSSTSIRNDSKVQQLNRRQPFAFQIPQSRRNVLESISQKVLIGGGSGVFSSAITGGTVFPNKVNAIETQTNENPSTLSPYSVYQIMPDASEKLSPSIQKIESTNFVPSNLLKENSGVIWLGEHHNSARDHNLQAQFIQDIYNKRLQAFNGNKNKNGLPITPQQHKLSIGLEQIQIQFQSVLDNFIAGSISEEQMLEQTQWSTRWSWPYENYRPVFNLARKLQIPLIALNVNNEDLAKVEVGGIRGLDKNEIRRYIKDPVGFSDFTRPTSYKAYSAYVIEPSYDMHKEMGILKRSTSGQILENDMSFLNFFMGRILWDESMAGNAFEWT
mmetsp:Transcript_2842/g.4029  ORF Transcript_2842/g.4029 Transcript_2842/m.4029 type:complete len:351 (+) Transcript_2842:61-1113(+)